MKRQRTEEISEATIAAWRQELAEHEAENMSHGELLDILIDGCEGYSNMDASEISKLQKVYNLLERKQSNVIRRCN